MNKLTIDTFTKFGKFNVSFEKWTNISIFKTTELVDFIEDEVPELCDQNYTVFAESQEHEIKFLILNDK